MVYVITGGAGFIGSMLCRLLVARGDEVVVIDNLSNGRRELVEELGPKARLVQADIRDTDNVRQIITDVRPQAVCHLAAIHFIPYCNEHPREALDVNVLGTLSVLEACKSAPPEMTVIASTAAVYDICDEPCRETDTSRPSDIYGVSKYADEHLAQLYVTQTGAPCVAARIFNAVGPNETNPHLLPHIVEQLNAGADCVALGNLEPRRDYIDTQDLARGLICLLDRKQEGYDVFNIGTGREYSVKEIVEICERILGRAIGIKQLADLVRKADRMHLCACNDKIKDATGWRPGISLAETLQDLLSPRRSPTCE
jgi:UDP-glucose 4-epimerase